MGLAVAIPGVLVQSVLNRRQYNLETDLMQVKDLLCSQTE
jgi:biopolymer transport protein ExbB